MPAADVAAEPARTFDVVVAVWGPAFRPLFLDVCLPNQLTPGNLGALPPGSRYRLFTSPDDVEAFERSPIVEQVRALMPVDIVVMPELAASSRSRFTRMTACHRRSLVDAREARSAVIFLCADHIIGEGTFAAVVRRHAAGSRAVMCTGVRVNRDQCLAELAARGGVRGVAVRELVAVAMQHLHPFTLAHMIDAASTPTRPISVYWKVPGEGLLARSFHLHPLMVDAVRRDVMPEDTIDGHFVRHACPLREQVHVVDDSDELAIFEMSHIDESVADCAPHGPTIWSASSMVTKSDSHQESYWLQPIRLHMRDLDGSWALIEQQSERFAHRSRTLGVVRRMLTARHLKRLAQFEGVRRTIRRMSKTWGARLRKSAVVIPHSAGRTLQNVRKRSAKVGRRVRGHARRSVALLTHRQ
jgi:hypothetical protein